MLQEALILLLSLQHLLLFVSGSEEVDVVTDDGHDDAVHHVHAHFAVLFPWFAQALGLIVFFVLTRYCHVLPYTAVMFLLGSLLGVCAVEFDWRDQLSDSIVQWSSIDAEVLFLVFLPGLIFKDAFSLNVFLFEKSLVQSLTMAFPMVLAGTTVTACAAYYILPYDWSFNLCLTLGSILSATDPVAVAALLEEVGAPPRLQMLVSGESLLNDGSAIVFFTIFSNLFLTELGNDDVGEDIGWAKGFRLFCRMSLGGAAIGFAFGIALIYVLYALDRKLNREETVVHVSATITTAYLTYYVAESVCGTSGVIATVCCGIYFKAFGKPIVNDYEMTRNFWILVEHLLNTLIFALGGVVWGFVVTDRGGRSGDFHAQDWGCLFLLYFMLLLIRFGLLIAFYPIIANTGLKTNWREVVFMGWGGLRGAIGIALAIALDNQVFEYSDDPDKHEASSQVFGMVGGVAFLTLVINGTTSGPVLKKLGLTQATKTRKKLMDTYKEVYRQNMLDNLVCLLSDNRYFGVNFETIQHHIPSFRDLSLMELKRAVIRHQEKFHPKHYRPPHLDCVITQLLKQEPEADVSWVVEITGVEAEEKEDDEKEVVVVAVEMELEVEKMETTTMEGVTKEEPEQPVAASPPLRRRRRKQGSRPKKTMSWSAQLHTLTRGSDMDTFFARESRRRQRSGDMIGATADKIFWTPRKSELADLKQSLVALQGSIKKSTGLLDTSTIMDDGDLKEIVSVELTKSERDEAKKMTTDNDDIDIEVNDKITTTSAPSSTEDLDERLLELRRMFVEMLRHNYNTMIANGDLSGREGLVAFVLLQSLGFATQSVINGSPLKDWEATQIVGNPLGGYIADKTESHTLKYWMGKLKNMELVDMEYRRLRHVVHCAAAFVEAHRLAQTKFVGELCGRCRDFSVAEEMLLSESKDEVLKATSKILEFDHQEVDIIIAHLLCSTLLHKAANFVEQYVSTGLMKDDEAEYFLEPIQEELLIIANCKMDHDDDPTHHGAQHHK